MPRCPRIIHAGEIYHVYARGNGRAPIYHEPGHRSGFLDVLGTTLPAAEVSILAYCLMDNHFHLVLRAGPLPLGRPMQRLLSAYARRLNREAGRTGHVFERRYQSKHVTSDDYLRAVLRYVHFNPVRAGIVSEPAAYRWSSHGAYLGGTAPDWLELGGLKEFFGGTLAVARRRYKAFCMETSDPPCPVPIAEERSPAAPKASNGAPASERNTPRAAHRRYDLAALVMTVSDVCGLPPSELLHGRDRRAARARGLAARAIQGSPGLNLSDFARSTGLQVSALSNAGRRSARYCQHNPELAGMWQDLVQALRIAG